MRVLSWTRCIRCSPSKDTTWGEETEWKSRLGAGVECTGGHFPLCWSGSGKPYLAILRLGVKLLWHDSLALVWTFQRLWVVCGFKEQSHYFDSSMHSQILAIGLVQITWGKELPLILALFQFWWDGFNWGRGHLAASNNWDTFPWHADANSGIIIDWLHRDMVRGKGEKDNPEEEQREGGRRGKQSWGIGPLFPSWYWSTGMLGWLGE